MCMKTRRGKRTPELWHIREVEMVFSMIKSDKAMDIARLFANIL